VAAALVRAALELGNASGPQYGVDPQREQQGNSWVAVSLSFAVYRLRIVLSGAVLKMAVRATVAQPTASYIAPWMVVPATAFWNAMVARGVMREAITTAIGISTSIELFNLLVRQYKDEHEHEHNVKEKELDERLRLQVCRAIAVAIVRCADTPRGWCLVRAFSLANDWRQMAGMATCTRRRSCSSGTACSSSDCRCGAIGPVVSMTTATRR
jgi:hypothetical protein